MKYEIEKITKVVTVRVTFPNDFTKTEVEEISETSVDDDMLTQAMERLVERIEKEWAQAENIPNTRWLNLGLIKAGIPNVNGDVFSTEALKDLEERYPSLVSYQPETDALYISVLVPNEVITWHRT